MAIDNALQFDNKPPLPWAGKLSALNALPEAPLALASIPLKVHLF